MTGGTPPSAAALGWFVGMDALPLVRSSSGVQGVGQVDRIGGDLGVTGVRSHQLAAVPVAVDLHGHGNPALRGQQAPPVLRLTVSPSRSQGAFTTSETVNVC